MKILVVHRGKAEYALLTKHLIAQGFLVDGFREFHEASHAIDDGYNCFILGIDRMSARQGMEFLKSVRSYYPKVPVLMLYLDETVDASIVKNLYMLGCDDVLKKPLIIEEVDSKIARLLHIRRDVIRFGKGGVFDFGLGMLQMGSTQQHFSTKEKRLLSVLFSHQECLVSFEAIKVSVWDGEEVNLESIRSLVRRVRQKIPFNCIETVVNSGYILKLETLKRMHVTDKKQTYANDMLLEVRMPKMNHRTVLFA